MSMWRERWVAAAGLIATSLILSGCGGGSPVTPPATPELTLPDEPTISPVNPEPTPSAEPTTMNRSDVVGPVQGAALVQALRKGGLLLWMRHTEQDGRPGTVTPEQVASHNCAVQSALTPTGRQNAQRIGAAIRALHLPITAVRTARLCRTETTGRLLRLAPVTEDARLDDASTWVDRGGAAAEQRATLRVLSEGPPAGTNVIVISDVLDVPDPQPAVLGELGPGEIAVFRPGSAGNATLLARIGESAWPTLLQAASITTPAPPPR